VVLFEDTPTGRLQQAALLLLSARGASQSKAPAAHVQACATAFEATRAALSAVAGALMPAQTEEPPSCPADGLVELELYRVAGRSESTDPRLAARLWRLCTLGHELRIHLQLIEGRPQRRAKRVTLQCLQQLEELLLPLARSLLECAPAARRGPPLR
jgi:hypothetical protein